MDIESVQTVQNASSSTVGGKSFQSRAKGFIAVKTFASLTQAIRIDLAKITFVYFYAGWHPESLSILQELQEISEGYLIDCNLVSLDTAEEGNFEICHKLGVDFVPKGFLITPDLQVVESLEVNDVNTTFDLVERQILLYKQNFEIEKVRATTKIQTLLSRHQAVLLIDEHFENNSLHSELLKHNLKVPVHNVSVGEAGSGNENPVNLKRWIPIYFGCRSFPQLFIQGKLFGDSTKIMEGLADGTLAKQMPKKYISGDVSARLSSVLSESKYLLLTVESASPCQPATPAASNSTGENIGDVLTSLGLNFRELHLTPSTTSWHSSLLSHIQSLHPSVTFPALFCSGQLHTSSPASLIAQRLSSLPSQFSPSQQTDETWGTPPLFVAKKTLSQSLVCVVGDGHETEETAAKIRGFGVPAKDLAVVGGLGFVVQCVKVLCAGRSFPRVFVRGAEIGSGLEVQQMIADGKFGEVVRPPKAKKAKGGCCQGDQPEASQGGGCCQSEKPQAKQGGGCCQDEGSAPRAGGCCQDSESEEDEDGCCGEKDDDGGCCGGH